MFTNKFERLTEDEVRYIYNWYIKQDKDTNLINLINKNPFFFLNSILRCRNKSKAIKALVFLSMSENHFSKTMFIKNFNRVVENIRDLVLFLEIAKNNRGFGKVIRRAIAGWFRSRTVEQLTYEFRNNVGNTLWTNRDILNEFHIKPWNDDVSKMFRITVETEKRISKNS